MPSFSTDADRHHQLNLTAAPNPPTLSLWVIGNPTSGGRRGAAVLGKLAKLFQKTYGADAVQETQSSSFLALAFPVHAPSASRPQRDADASAHLPSLDALWRSGAAPSMTRSAAGPTPPITPPSSPQPEDASSLTAILQVRTMFIHTDHSGHATAVSNALSRLILRSRLEDRAGTQHHLVLVVGGDGTLSEVVNGLCEGTLAAYHHFVAAQQSSTAVADARNGKDHRRAVSAASAAAAAGAPALLSSSSSSYAQVEEEAAVFTHLLPALLYVPGGTGADFAKLGLCCPTPEAALHVVRDGLAKALQHRLTEQSTPRGAPRQSSTACYGCAVDVGRIEFLSSGTRHFFINICSIGMSCDVIRRGERFKRSPVVSRLGGTLLFALSALISLLLMTPKPLYLCRLPPRVTRTPVAETERRGGDAEEDTLRNSSAGAGAAGAAGSSSSTTSALSSLAPFSPLRLQLRRLYDHLCPPSSPAGNAPTSAAAPSREASELGEVRPSQIFSSSNGDSVYTRATNESAYAYLADTVLPPPDARTVQCSNAHNPSREAQQLLDMEERELRLLRCHNAQEVSHVLSDPTCVRSGGKTSVQVNDDVGHVSGIVLPSTPSKAAQDSRSPIHPTQTQRPNPSSPTPGDDQRAESGGVQRRLKDGHDDMSALTWVEMPSSMVAFANGRWYGGGMHVAPHADPTDGLLSCTNWVATVLPFISGVFSLYTGRHLRWRSTSAFDGERFLVTHVVPDGKEPEKRAEPLFMEADGEVLEAVPAVVELVGKITFIVPQSSQLCVGAAAPGSTREQLDTAAAAATSAAAAATAVPSVGERLRRSVSGVGSLFRRSWSSARRWVWRDGRYHADDHSSSGEEGTAGRPTNGSARTPWRVHNGNADEYV